ncbi:30S ribosomal protein S21 [Schleiferia thermophila]|jgi:small subunit ribosomal protein S21|uniref:Small ribosomal subunit protein bS21 n=1 Tax=Schleiferia thermophila TaxID=884107 RepID=A0A369A8M2_9FLAO|nr:30S ribosomal protein S21 [Schleiferia thermophila]KFD39626.1 30S ribosomal protein S21 [Schleiferia thermophila str. Yellowstone]PMB13710.1 30S ribosomal protein S21 [Fischerella thermalis CCMEE 5319]RCX03774.1 small subunit ribosomal protein S21 [Schleiferia thermophila]GCD80007.1 30S ribosomal protein S21 [Schleiferia thermophila]
MIHVTVKEGESIEKALKRYKKKFDKIGIVRTLRDKQHFTKPSVKRRNQILKAIFTQKIRSQQEA